jgi:hypothetical protein
MNATAPFSLLAYFRSQGVELRLAGPGDLRASGKGLSPEVLIELRACKAALIAEMVDNVEDLVAARPLDDPDAEARRQRLLAMLIEGREFAIVAEAAPDGSYRLVFGNRAATCELHVPRARDPLALADALADTIERGSHQ